MQLVNSFSDERDAARLALLCVDTALAASVSTNYCFAQNGPLFAREEAVSYLEKTLKPVKIRVERKNEETISLLVAASNKPTGVDPLDIGASLRESLALTDDSVVEVRRASKPQFGLRLSALALWQRSYDLINVEYTAVVREADTSGRAAQASAVMNISPSGGGVSAVFLR